MSSVQQDVHSVEVTMPLLEPYRLGDLTLKNRTVMSAMTRNRAGVGNVPGPPPIMRSVQRPV